MMSHQAYFEFLAGSDQNAPAWHPVLAGLAVLRFVDSRLGEESRFAPDWASLESTRSAVTALNEGDPVRGILLRLIEAISGEEISPETVGRELIAYGRALNFEGRWALACDVFTSADKMTGAPHHPHISIESNIALGAASRRMGDWDASGQAYARAAHLADTLGDRATTLHVEVGRATTHMVRGNLPTAESMLESVIEQARAGGLNDVLGRALHSRMSVAHLKGEFAEAIRVGHQGLEVMTDPTQRDGLMSDIAAAFGGLGLHDSARDGYLIVAATAQSQWVRWQATLNLMELAALDDREADFKSYARELDSAPLDPKLRATYYLFLGAGQQKFATDADAEASFTEGLAVAQKHQLHQLAHDATVALSALKVHGAPRRALTTPPAEVPLSLRMIASELSDLREAAMSSP
jgi:hypothetical protein